MRPDVKWRCFNEKSPWITNVLDNYIKTKIIMRIALPIINQTKA